MLLPYVTVTTNCRALTQSSQSFFASDYINCYSDAVGFVFIYRCCYVKVSNIYMCELIFLWSMNKCMKT